MPQSGPIRQVHVDQDGHVSVRLRSTGTNFPVVEEWHAYTVGVQSDGVQLYNISAFDQRTGQTYTAFERPRREKPTVDEVEQFFVRSMLDHPSKGVPSNEQWLEAYARERVSIGLPAAPPVESIGAL